MLFIKVYKKSCDVVGVVKAGIAIFPGYVDHKTRIYKNIRQIQVFDMIVKPYKILVVVLSIFTRTLILVFRLNSCARMILSIILLNVGWPPFRQRRLSCFSGLPSKVIYNDPILSFSRSLIMSSESRYPLVIIPE